MPVQVLADTMSSLSAGMHIAKILDIIAVRLIGAAGEVSFVSNTHIVSIAHTAGESEYSINGGDTTKVNFNQDDLTYTPPSTAVISNALTPYDSTTLYIPHHWFETALSAEMSLGYIVPKHFLMADDILYSSASLLASLAFSSDAPPDPLFSEMIVVRIATRVLHILSKSQPATSPAHKAQALTQQKLELISDYIEANVHRTIRTTELAILMGMSESHFSRSFKSTTGVTAMRFIMGRRVDRAKDLLCHTRKTLAEIAFDCGFASQSHFTTSFKDTLGKTPAAFRSDTWWKAAGFAISVMPALQVVLDYIGA